MQLTDQTTEPSLSPFSSVQPPAQWLDNIPLTEDRGSR